MKIYKDDKGREYKVCLNPGCERKIWKHVIPVSFWGKKFHDLDCQTEFTQRLNNEVSKRNKVSRFRMKKKILKEWGVEGS